MATSKPTAMLAVDLKFEKKNKPQCLLPPNITIQRRPLNHAPVASPYADASVQKVVYVSSKTPIMAAVKRVKKLLSHIERRAMQHVDITNGNNGIRKLTEASENLRKNGEEVVVKASGRAIERAMKVGDWFKSKEDEVQCRVEVRTGNVQVVDDLIEIEEQEGTKEDVKMREADGGEDAEHDKEVDQSDAADEDKTPNQEAAQSLTQDKETGHDVVQQEDAGKQSIRTETATSSNPAEQTSVIQQTGENTATATGAAKKNRKRGRRGKRKRPTYDKDDVPEARIRWIHTIEVAISLKG